jgi:hypothetical protein
MKYVWLSCNEHGEVWAVFANVRDAQAHQQRWFPEGWVERRSIYYGACASRRVE